MPDTVPRGGVTVPFVIISMNFGLCFQATMGKPPGASLILISNYLNCISFNGISLSLQTIAQLTQPDQPPKTLQDPLTHITIIYFPLNRTSHC